MLTSPDNDEQNLTFASSDEAAPDAIQEDVNANVNDKHQEPPLASWFSQYSTSISSGSRNVSTTTSNNISKGNKSGKNGVIVDAKEPVTKNINGRPTDGDKIPSIANNNNNTDNNNINNNISNTEWGMVSDNEEDEDEGFNFVAVSNSLLMAGRSFEHVSEEINDDGGGGGGGGGDDDDDDDAANSDTTCGVLIVDGLNNDNDVLHPACPDSNFGGIGPSTASPTNNNATTSTTTTTTNGGNIDSSSTLSIPGSDSLPSDLGTLSHHDDDNFFGGNNNKGSDDDEEGNHGSGSGSGSEGTAGTGGTRGGEDPYHRNYPPLIHRFLMNLQQNTHRRRLVSDNNDDHHHDDHDDDASRSIIHQDNESIHQYNDNDDDVVVGTGGEEKILLDHQHRGEKPSSSFDLRKKFCGISVMSIMSIALVTSLIVLMSWTSHSFVVNQRRQEEEWNQRLLQEEEHKARLMAEKDELRLEMEALQKEAAVAWARADSLAKEQERWTILQQETERMARKQQQQQQQQDEEEQRGSRKRGRRQDNYDSQEKDNNNNGDFSWFFNDKNEDCNADRRKNEESGGGSTTYTIADNCWVKAKADINLGSCGDDTKDFFKDVWNGLWYSSWDDWDNYFDTTTSSNTIGETYDHGGSSSSSKQEGPQQEKEGQQSNHDDAADTDPSPEDPFQELFSVITSVGQSFASKFSQLVTDEVDTTRKAAEDLEDVVLRRYADVSKTFSNTMYAMKDDMRDLSKETLSTLRAAVKNNNSNSNNQDDKGTASKTNRQHSSSSSQSNDDEDATTGYDTKSTTTSSSKTQPVTRQGLDNAVVALSSLSKAWHETTKSLSSLIEEDVVGRKDQATTDE
jgi:hypothetical protein